MKNLTSPNEPLQANKAEEGSHSLEADQRILCISIISIIYILATATAATTTPALCVYSWTLMHRSRRAAPCLLHQLLPSPSHAQAPSAWQHTADKGIAHLPLARRDTGARIPTQHASVQLCPADNPLRREAGLLLQTSSGSEILAREGPVKAGLQGEHPVHRRASAATVQGRISRGCFPQSLT